MLDTKKFLNEKCCKLCGYCLSRCPVFEFSREKAKEEKAKLNIGKKSIVLDRCASCFSCDLYCPNGCEPYELVLLRWNERYKSRGLPPLARMVVPTDPLSIWKQLYPLLPLDEEALIKNWRSLKNKKGKEILLTGCFSALSPYLTMTPILRKLTPYGDERLWCSGGHIYQLGLLEVVEAIGKKAKSVFEELSPRRVVTMMAAEYSMLTNILPKKFGINFDFEVVPLEKWIAEQINNGEIRLSNKINKRITIHDNCFSKSVGKELWQVVRDIAGRCCDDIVEMEHNREDALCCGFGSAAGKFNIFDLIEGGLRRLSEAEDTGANWIIVYCSACYFILSVVKEIVGSKVEIYHIIELLDLADGRRPVHRTRQGAYDILSIMSANITRMLVNTKESRRFWIDMSDFDSKTDLSHIDMITGKLPGFYSRLYNSLLLRNKIVEGGLHKVARAMLDLRRKRRKIK